MVAHQGWDRPEYVLRDLWHTASPDLGPWEGPSDVTFVRDGKPFYIQGPYDNVRRITSTLDRAVGQEKYLFIMAG